MTNAIEQTRRQMYFELTLIRRSVKSSITLRSSEIDKFENKLEAHLEELRKGMMAINESTVKCAQHSADAVVELEQANDQLVERLMSTTEERDTLRNKLQALQMASSTAAEVIRGLRSELEEAREGISKSANEGPIDASPYALGFTSAGMSPNPFPVNTVERLHWNNGASDAITAKNHSYGGFDISSGAMFFGDKS